MPAYDFGRRSDIVWREIDPEWTPRQLAQLDASKLQHSICFGVSQLYMPSSEDRKFTHLAAALGVKPDRFYKMMTGQVVMQLEDIGRLRRHIGPRIDFWMLRGDSADLVRRIEGELHLGVESGHIRRPPDIDSTKAGDARH